MLARKQGLARTSAVTFGIGAASVLGAVAIAVTLPGSAADNATQSDHVAAITHGTSTDTTANVFWSQRQTTKNPGTMDGPRVLTSVRP